MFVAAAHCGGLCSKLSSLALAPVPMLSGRCCVHRAAEAPAHGAVGRCGTERLGMQNHVEASLGAVTVLAALSLSFLRLLRPVPARLVQVKFKEGVLSELYLMAASRFGPLIRSRVPRAATRRREEARPG